MPRSRGFTHQSRSRRRRGWEVGPGDTTVTAVSSSSAVFMGAGASALQDGLTLARLRGRFAAFLDTATGIGDGFSGAFGIGIVKAPAFAAGISSVPTPIAEQDDDSWIFWMPVQVFAQDASDAGLGRGAFQEIVVDSKAMRKLNEGDVIYAALEVVLAGTAVADFRFDSRALLLLP